MKKLGLAGSLAVYVPASILMYCMTSYLIPFLSSTTGQETILFWFIVAGLGIFLPLIITGVLILKSEGYRCSKEILTVRLRFRKITGNDLLWSLGGLILAGLLSAAIMKGLELAIGKFDHAPAFMSFEPLTPGRYWLLAVFGWQLLLTLIPLIFIQSYIVQRTRNSWVGVIMHGGLNGPSFLAICFGWI